MVGDLEGRVAVVTGGTGGLGSAVVRVLASAGARVHVPWWTEAEVGPFQDQMESAGVSDRVSMDRMDVRDEASVDAFFSTLHKNEGPVWSLVNGVGGFAVASLEETSAATWQTMMSLNATSALLCTRAAVRTMGDEGGRVIMVAAMPAVGRGARDMSAYAASKAAVLNLTFSLSSELRPRKITVNAVVPTTINTPANRRAMPDADRSTWLEAEEIAEVMRFLASDRAAIVTGATLTLGRG